ncbi:MAG: hypothetical protein J2P55_00190 [Rhizobiales bacterium]|nr:hypothetical protein [Hyphomicrobiales bacterium]
MPAHKSTSEHDQWLDEIVPLTEAAQLRKVSVQTLRGLIRSKKLRAVRLSVRKLGMTRREATRAFPRGLGIEPPQRQ